MGTIDDEGTDEAMILESRVLALNAPSSRTVRNLKIWFKSTSVFALRGRDEHLFENKKDLVALAPVETDRLNVFLSSYFGWFLKVCKPLLACALLNEAILEMLAELLCRVLVRRIIIAHTSPEESSVRGSPTRKGALLLPRPPHPTSRRCDLRHAQRHPPHRRHCMPDRCLQSKHQNTSWHDCAVHVPFRWRGWSAHQCEEGRDLW